jgi:hypothetical protein
MKTYDTLVDALNDLRKRGYEVDFSTQTVCLYCGDLDIRLYPEEFHVDEVYRFEEDSNPDDNSILYAISASRGMKGTLVDLYGAYSDNLSFDMAKKLSGNPVQN